MPEEPQDQAAEEQADSETQAAGEETPQDQEEQQPDGGEDESQGDHWLDGFESLKGNEALKEFEGPEAALKAYLDLKEQTAVPEKYSDLKMPEGLEPDQDFLTAFRTTAKQAGLTDKQFAALGGLYNQRVADQVRAFEEQKASTMTELRKTWGSKADANIEAARQGLAKLAGERAGELAELLEATGMGNHGLIVQLGYNAHKLTGEDKVVPGEQKSGKRSAAEVMYGGG